VNEVNRQGAEPFGDDACAPDHHFFPTGLVDPAAYSQYEEDAYEQESISEK
jgi:hypothetical protein